MGEKMTIFAVNMKHTPESCPMFNEEVMKKLRGAISKREELAEKYGIKILSAYTSTIEHTIFYILEASSQQSVESYFVKIGMAFWNTVDISQVTPVEDVIKKIVE
ncbi:MAG: hypothetical protein MUO26_03105 [Methanotrichaceae archaeon]|nr:hypothetical protein [Methanotrichaceae archaeon]